MKSLIRKDLFLLKNSKKTLAIIIIFSIFLIIFSNKTDNKLTIDIMMFSLMYTIFSVSYTSLFFDSDSKFNEYMELIPITKKEYVKSKFYFAFIFYILETIFSIIYIRFLNELFSYSLIIKIMSIQFILGGLILYTYFKKGDMNDVIKIVKYSFFIIFLLMIFILKISEKINLNHFEFKEIYSLVIFILSIIIFFVFMKLSIGREDRIC